VALSPPVRDLDVSLQGVGGIVEVEYPVIEIHDDVLAESLGVVVAHDRYEVVTTHMADECVLFADIFLRTFAVNLMTASPRMNP